MYNKLYKIKTNNGNDIKEFIKNKITNLDYLLIKLFIIIFLLLGMIINSSLIWSIIDTLVLFLLIINIYTIIKLRKEIK